MNQKSTFTSTKTNNHDKNEKEVKQIKYEFNIYKQKQNAWKSYFMTTNTTSTSGGAAFSFMKLSLRHFRNAAEGWS